MEFKVSRTSKWQEEKPCEEAYKKEMLVKIWSLIMKLEN